MMQRRGEAPRRRGPHPPDEVPPPGHRSPNEFRDTWTIEHQTLARWPGFISPNPGGPERRRRAPGRRASARRTGLPPRHSTSAAVLVARIRTIDSRTRLGLGRIDPLRVGADAFGTPRVN